MELICLHENPWSTSHLESDYPLVKGITDYHYESWEWHGSFIAVDEKGTWYSYSVGHCSCYWPLDSPKSWRFTKDEILKLHPKFREFIEAN